MIGKLGRLLAVTAVIMGFVGIGRAAETEVDPSTVSDGRIVLKNPTGGRPEWFAGGGWRES
jgi:hypothetical protein